jgi:hypothetical protein
MPNRLRPSLRELENVRRKHRDEHEKEVTKNNPTDIQKDVLVCC